MQPPSSSSLATQSRTSSAGAAIRLAGPVVHVAAVQRTKAFRRHQQGSLRRGTTPTRGTERPAGLTHGSLLSQGRSAVRKVAAGCQFRPAIIEPRTPPYRRPKTNAKYESALVAFPGRLSSRRGCKQPVASRTLSAMRSSRSLSSVARLSGWSARRPQPSNPSIEGTSNTWLRQLSPAPHVKR